MADPGRHAIHLPWVLKATALLKDPALAGRVRPLHALVRARCVPGFVTPPPRCPLAEFEEELAVLRATPAEMVRADLAAVRESTPLVRQGISPDNTPDVLPELAVAVQAWWDAAVRPHWPRIRAVLESDLAHRTRQLAGDGIQRVFTGLHPTVQWASDRLISADLPSVELNPGGAGVTLAQSVFASRCRILTGHGPSPVAVVYPARAVGTVWERRHTEHREGLARRRCERWPVGLRQAGHAVGGK